MLLLLACAPDPVAAPPLDEVVDEEPAPILPVEGVWSVDRREVLEDQCGGLLGEDTEDNGDTLDLLVEGDQSFVIVMTFDDGESFEIGCERDDAAFVCEGSLDVYEISDTVLTATWFGGGVFHDDESLSATLDATASCEGSLCEVAEEYLQTPLPCDGAMAMDASYLEAF